MDTVHVALLGGLVASCVYAATFFLRSWRRSGDRFHGFLAAAMTLLAVNWVGVVATRPAGEAHSEVYLLRLVAFVLILFAIVDKNRRA
jgi:hypothetical protein